METSSLCAKIPVELHQKVREKQQDSGLSLGDFMADLLEKYFNMENEEKMSNKNRTMALQMTDEDFYRLKAHLKRTGEKQKEFMYRAIFDIIASAESEIPTEVLQDQLLDAEISGEKKSRNRNKDTEQAITTEASTPHPEEQEETDNVSAPYDNVSSL
ncbi:MAG: hypothetical protein R3Y63_09495 [Eubacteriales bacterium]